MFVVEKDGDKGSEYGDTSAQMWNLYGLESEKYDKALVESWMGNTNSMLIFTGLFSTIVASLLIETYKTLRVDSGPETVALLIQVISQSNISRPSSTPIGGSQPTTATASAVRINILMFLSLFLSVSSALASTLVQQWARDYLQYSQPNAAPHKRGRVRAYMFSGLSQFQMRRFIEGVPVLLHASVFLFFWALSDFLHTIDAVVGLVARYSLVALLAVYMTLSISPLISGNSPYQTALTTPIKALVLIIHSFLTAAKRLARTTSPNLSQGDSGSSRAIKLNREVVLMDEANSRAPELDRFALHWLLQKLDGGDMDEFLKGLPGYVSSPLTEAKNLAEGLAAEHILRRIREHFTACVMSFELSEEACMSRVLACVSSLRLIFESSGTRTGGSDAGYIRAIIEHLDELCKRPDSVVALRASSVRCLAFHGFLIPYVRTDLQSLSDQRFPDYLVPLYAFLRTRKNTSSGQWRDLPTTPSVDAIRLEPSDTTMWEDLVHDGPLENLAVFADAILSHVNVRELNLDMCWRTLDTLLTSLGIAQAQASNLVQTRFEEVHSRVRDGVERNDRGGRLTPLLEVLNIVVRGRHLATAFLRQPKVSTANVTEAMFGQEHLENSDLLEAFAKCLPKFLSDSGADRSAVFMERIVSKDDLWTKLQVNLQTCMQADRPIRSKVQVFVACHDVLDAAFSSLASSQDANWRAPEFGSLVNHVELFWEECFRDVFAGRYISFRTSLFNAQLYQAILIQFSEVSRGQPLSLRSEWDIVALARLFIFLDVVEKADVEFWESFTRKRRIEGELLTRAQKLLDVAARDGPLYNFCRLGVLATIELPLGGSDSLPPEDVEKLWKLLRRLVKDPRLPLIKASDRVWAEFKRLRKLARRSGVKGGSDVRSKLQPLLDMIEEINLMRLARNDTESDSHHHRRAEDAAPYSGYPHMGSAYAYPGLYTNSPKPPLAALPTGYPPPASTLMQPVAATFTRYGVLPAAGPQWRPGPYSGVTDSYPDTNPTGMPELRPSSFVPTYSGGGASWYPPNPYADTPSSPPLGALNRAEPSSAAHYPYPPLSPAPVTNHTAPRSRSFSRLTSPSRVPHSGPLRGMPGVAQTDQLGMPGDPPYYNGLGPSFPRAAERVDTKLSTIGEEDSSREHQGGHKRGRAHVDSDSSSDES